MPRTGQRNYGANVTGSWAEYVINATLRAARHFRHERPPDCATATCRGSACRAANSRSASPRSTSVRSASTSTFVRKTIVNDETQDRPADCHGFDVLPTLRVPFNEWPFLSVNSVVSWRGTYWSESLDASGCNRRTTVGRSFFDLQSTVRGPTFHRIWDNGTGRKIKHVIEPSLAIQRTSAYRRLRTLRSPRQCRLHRGRRDALHLRAEQRLYSKRENTREVMTVRVFQTYYTDARAAQYDQNYQSVGVPPRTLAPIAITARVAADRRPRRQTFRPSGITRSTRSGRSRPAGQPRAQPLAPGGSGLEPAPCDPRAPGLQRNGRQPLPECLDDAEDAAQQLRRHLLVQLRLAAGRIPAATVHGLLQRAVLRRSPSSGRPGTTRARSRVSPTRRTTGSTSLSPSRVSARCPSFFGALSGQQNRR